MRFQITDRLPALAAVVLFTLITVGNAQNWQHSYDSSGNLEIRLAASTNARPQILGQPQLQIVSAGDLASFSVVMADARGLSYQWRFNSANLVGSTSDTLLLGNVSITNEGTYSVVVANSSGSVTSAPALLMLDSDEDGLPDSWELTFFSDLSSQRSAGDADGDGISNLNEFFDGTSPTNRTSARFRLTLGTDGGVVTIVPARLSYTNGETVTLTATASGREIFHGWAGDIITRSNSVTLSMTNNKTVFAYFNTVNITWTNLAGGDWHMAQNWKPNVVPTALDNVFITDQVTVTVDQTAECGGLTLNSSSGWPYLTGSGTLTLSKPSFWVGGTMRGSGRTIIAEGATLNVVNPNNVTLDNRTLENGGTILLAGANFSLSSAAVITNRAGALFEIQGAGSMPSGGGAGISRIDNAGTFRKSIHTGTMSIGFGVNFNNYNTVQIQSGGLTVGSGGVNTGSYEVPAGTALELSGGTFTSSAGSSITGGGRFTVSGGVTATLAGLVNLGGTNTFSGGIANLTGNYICTNTLIVSGGLANLTGNYICTNNTAIISGGTVNFDGVGPVTPAAVNLSGGNLGGGNLVTVGTAMNWTGGAMRGSGRTIIPAGVTLSIANANSVTLDARTLENGGTVLWTGANFSLSSAAVVTNRAGALFEIQGAGSMPSGGGAGVSRIDNAGTFRKSIHTGAMSIGFGVNFNNFNTVQIQSGGLTVGGGGVNTGSYEVPAGTALELSGGTFTSSPGSSITGGGRFTVSGGVTATLAGLVNLGGTNTFSGGIANLTGNYICTNTLIVSGGLANLSGNCICTNNTVIISGGTVNFDGAGPVTPAAVNLSGGNLGGGNLVTVGTAMNWTGGAMRGSGRTIIPAGVTLNVVNANNVTLDTRTLENGGIVLWTGATITLSSAAAITNRLGALFETRGAGDLNYGGGGGGSCRFDNAGTFRKSVHTGTTIISGQVNFNNDGAVEIQKGILVANGGYTSTAGALLNCAIAGTTPGTGYGQLQVGGAVTLNGALRVNLSNAFTPATNDAFTVLSAGSRSGTFANFYYPSNAVTMQLSNTANSVIVQVVNVFPIPIELSMSIALSGTNVLISWPTDGADGFKLQSANTVPVGESWVAVADLPAVVGERSHVILPLTLDSQFYRLQK